MSDFQIIYRNGNVASARVGSKDVFDVFADTWPRFYKGQFVEDGGLVARYSDRGDIVGVNGDEPFDPFAIGVFLNEIYDFAADWSGEHSDEIPHQGEHIECFSRSDYSDWKTRTT